MGVSHFSPFPVWHELYRDRPFSSRIGSFSKLLIRQNHTEVCFWMIPLESVNTFAVLSICYATNFGASYDNLRLAELGGGGLRNGC
jgi:hypothetical protein